MAATWLGITSANLDSSCGSTTGKTCAEALDGTDYWGHTTNEDHWFIIDLGSSLLVYAVRGRSYTSYDPTNVNIYVSDSKVDWGVAVAEDIATWQDCSDGNWVEVDTTDKTGRYVKVEVDVTEAVYNLQFGRYGTPFFGIFDVQVEAAQNYNEGTKVVTGVGSVLLSTETATFAYDEGTLVVAGVGSAVLSVELVTFAYDEGVLVVSGSGVVSLSKQSTSWKAPSDRVTYKRLVAAAKNKIYYESV
jgi:hypothetical protein